MSVFVLAIKTWRKESEIVTELGHVGVYSGVCRGCKSMETSVNPPENSVINPAERRVKTIPTSQRVKKNIHLSPD